MTRPSASSFRAHLRSPDDPRIAGISELDAYSFVDRVLAHPVRAQLFDGWLQRYRETEFEGITTDGQCIPDLFALADNGAPVVAAQAAALQLLSIVDPPQRAALCHRIDARQWRAWMNPELYLNRFGLRLDEVQAPVQQAVLDVLRASLSAAGYERTRTLMRINHFLGELVNAPRILNEFSYNFNLFGTPSRSEPWGWNFYGHHVCLNCLMLGGQMVVTPVFMGAEPNCIDTGPHAGLTAFTDEESLGLALMQSLPAQQQRRAQLYRLKRDPRMPPGRIAIGDELHLAGAFQDNRVIPYEGVCAADWSSALQRQLLALMESYLRYLPAEPLRARMAEIERHLANTHFCWIGGFEEDSPFYYRIQSPVLIIEFDHHAGVFLGNAEPEKFHVHTLVRTPNGNDYGMALVRQHCELRQQVLRDACLHQAPDGGHHRHT